MPGLSSPSGLATSISVRTVRVAGSKASVIRVTLPGQVRSAISGTRTTASTPGLHPGVLWYIELDPRLLLVDAMGRRHRLLVGNAGSIEVFDFHHRKRAHVHLPMELLDGDCEGRQGGHGLDCEDFRLDHGCSSQCHQARHCGQSSQQLYHGNLMFADVMMAPPHYGRISAVRESRYIGSFEGGTPTHAAHGMADVRSAPADCSSADFGRYVNKIAGTITHMAHGFFHAPSSPNCRSLRQPAA